MTQTPENLQSLPLGPRMSCRPASDVARRLVELFYDHVQQVGPSVYRHALLRALCVAAEHGSLELDADELFVTAELPAEFDPVYAASLRRAVNQLERLLHQRRLAAGWTAGEIRRKTVRRATRRIVDAEFAAARPRGEVGRMVVGRYAALLEGRTLPTSEREIVKELRKLTERNELAGEPAQISGLLRPGPTDPRWRCIIKRQLEVRLIRLLEAEGVIEPREDRNARRKTATLIDTAPAQARRTLTLWARWRETKLALPAIRDEIRRLVELEQVIEETGGRAHEGLLTLWLRRLSKEVVNCTCHPQWKRFDDQHCRRCGATAERVGTRSSIREARLRQYRSEGVRYLEFRRQPAETRLFA
jgi:hypothetical protein